MMNATEQRELAAFEAGFERLTADLRPIFVELLNKWVREYPDTPILKTRKLLTNWIDERFIPRFLFEYEDRRWRAWMPEAIRRASRTLFDEWAEARSP